MKAVMLSVLAALGAQIVSLPFLIGGRNTSGAETIGWTLILSMFFMLPFAVLFIVMFSLLRVALLPNWAVITVGALTPALIVLLIFRGQPAVLSTNNYVLMMAIVGGLTGGVVLTRLT